MSRTIMIDEPECIGCESCVEICPNAFAMNDSGDKAIVVDENCTDECVDEAIDTCPVDCISAE